MDNVTNSRAEHPSFCLAILKILFLSFNNCIGILNKFSLRILNFRIIILESTNIENRISQIILRAFFYRFVGAICKAMISGEVLFCCALFKKRIVYYFILASIYTGATEDTFGVFNFVLIYQIFNRKAHWAVVTACMAVFTFIGFYL